MEQVKSYELDDKEVNVVLAGISELIRQNHKLVVMSLGDGEYHNDNLELADHFRDKELRLNDLHDKIVNQWQGKITKEKI